MAKRKKQLHTFEPRIENRRAFRDYHIDDKLECGIQLTGSEVKSVRMGQVSLAEGYAAVEIPPLQLGKKQTGSAAPQLMLYNVEISPYPYAGAYQHVPKRPRKLLAHKRQINQLLGRTSSKGTTLVPLAMYFVRGMIKLEIGVAQGKKDHDKRQDIKKREADREIRRAMSKKL